MTMVQVVEDPLDAMLNGPSPGELRIGLAIPQSGVLGLTGPAALAAAVLAAEEANDVDVLHGRQVRLVPIDAGSTGTRAAGASVVTARLVPFGSPDIARMLAELRRHRVQAVLLSLVGRDLATFNRGFADSPLLGSVVRVSGALEEAGLLEIDGDSSGELYAVMSWFATDPDDEFRERYLARYGRSAPQLGAYARGCYHGIQAMTRLAADGRLTVRDIVPALRHIPTERRCRLARAEGLDLRAIA